MPDGAFLWLGHSTFRNAKRLFGIPQQDRRHHMYLVGQTGTGKSSLLHACARQDIVNGNGFALVDPHGDLFEAVRHDAARFGRSDVVSFDLFDQQNPVRFNPLRVSRIVHRPLAAAGVLDVFSKLWEDSWGPRLEHLLRYALLALVDLEGSHLGDVLRIMRDDKFRLRAAASTSNEQVRAYWLSEFVKMSPGRQREAVAPVENKIGAFLAHEPLRRALCSPDNSCDIRAIMDAGGVLLVNLAKGRLGEDASSLFGALLISTLARLGLERADQPETARRDFVIYGDEFQSFTTLSVASMLAELRKYRVHVVLAHQFLGQLETELREAILGNAGTVISFRLGPTDARVIAPVLGGEIKPIDIMALPNHNAFVRLMVNGVPVEAMSAETLHFPRAHYSDT